MLKVNEERFRLASDYFVRILDFMDYLKIWNLLDKSVLVSNGISICCPFHADWDPSFKIDLKKNIYKCFACGENGGGNILSFISRYNKEVLGNNTNYYKILDSLIKTNPRYIADLGFDTIFTRQELSVSSLDSVINNRVNLKTSAKKDLPTLLRKLKEKGDKEQILDAISMVQQDIPIELIYNRLFNSNSSLKNTEIFDKRFIEELIGEEEE